MIYERYNNVYRTNDGTRTHASQRALNNALNNAMKRNIKHIIKHVLVHRRCSRAQHIMNMRRTQGLMVEAEPQHNGCNRNIEPTMAWQS